MQLTETRPNVLSSETRSIIKSTVPVLETHGEQITVRFYERLFDTHPELLNFFNQANQRRGNQQTALAGAVYAAASHIDNLEAILPAVKQINEKHRALGVKPEHYPIVGENLLLAMQDVLGDAATPEILDAWAQAYGVIADAFAGVETQLYRDSAAMPGGWIGSRPFRVQRKVVESDVIQSFYLEPQDGKAIARFQPGQYLTLTAKVPGQEYLQRRHYSLSDAPGKPYYRLSIKRESAIGDSPAGIMSNYLHDDVHVGDILDVAAPAGDFKLDAPADKPIVFLSGGIGMTPLVSMVNTLMERGDTRPITYIHAALHSSVHAFQVHLRELAKQHANLKYHVVYERPHDEDRHAPHFAKEGFVDLPWLKTVASQDALFYFCGPKPFMQAVYKALRTWGVADDHIRYEFFGPQGQLDA